MAFGGGAGSEFHLQEYKGKKPGLYKEEGIGTVRVGAEGEVKFYRLGEKVPPVVVRSLRSGRTPDPQPPVEETTTEEPTAPTAPTTRVSEKGVVQRGLDLDAINALFKSQSDKGRMSQGELGNSSKYLSTALPATEVGKLQLEKPLVPGASPTQKPNVSSTDEQSLPYGTQLPEGTKPFASTTPYKTGGTPSESQDGTSPKPDRVERLRQIGFNGADFSGDEPDDSTLVSPMYANKERNAARAAFLDPNNRGYNAIRARDRAVGTFDQNGKGGVMIDGKIQEFNEGMSRDARFELSGGLNSSEQAQAFKDKYLKSVLADTGETGTKPETPATPEVESPTPTESTFTPIWKTTPLPDSGAPKGGWDKHFSDMEKNR